MHSIESPFWKVLRQEKVAVKVSDRLPDAVD
jgi:hypothetical protein